MTKAIEAATLAVCMFKTINTSCRVQSNKQKIPVYKTNRGNNFRILRNENAKMTPVIAANVIDMGLIHCCAQTLPDQKFS